MNQLTLDLQLTRAEFSLHVELDMPLGGVIVIYGPSGSGKTSLLRCIAGLERAKGRIQAGSKCFQTSDYFCPVWQRNIGYVFQESSLLPHLTAYENIRYATKRSRQSISSTRQQKILEMLGIVPVLKRTPDQLSGGERQRVAIARALMSGAEMLLMDEPLAALDQSRKSDIVPFLETLKRDSKIPILYVTHSLDELTRLADQVIEMDNGRVKSLGSVNDFLVSSGRLALSDEEARVVLDGVILRQDEIWNLTDVNFGDLILTVPVIELPVGSLVRIQILANDVSLSREKMHETSVLNQLQADVESIQIHGQSGLATVTVSAGGKQLLSKMSVKSTSMLGLIKGTAVWVSVKTAALA